jgi:hypothetical protein
MKLTSKIGLFAVALAGLLACTPGVNAQQGQGQGQGQGQRGNRPNFDPAQMQQRMMERYREQLEITSDDEWKAVEPLLQKVMDARRESMAGGMRGMFGRGPGGQGGPGGDQAGGNRQRGGMFGEPDPAVEALQKAIEAKAPASELKAAMAKVRDNRKAAEEKLKKAQEELRKVLSTRQEAVLVANGTLN